MITVATSKLVDLLSDALHTASPVHGGVYLSCHRAPYLEEPGDVDLLAATSTTGFVVGHSWIPVDGYLTAAVWPVGNTATALGVLKRLSKKAENHTVDIDMVLADPPENMKEGDHPGWIVSISESAALFDSDTVHQFHVHHESRFPVAGVARTLAGVVRAAEGDEYVETPLTTWSAGVLGALVKVAKRNGGSIRMFRSARSRLQVVQIGLTWLGAAYPERPSEGVDTDGPSIEPVLPVDAETAAAAMLRAGAGVVSAPQGSFDDIVGVSGGDEDAGTSTESQTASNVDDGELLRHAIELVVSTGFASPSMIQRKLNVGLARANRLLEDMAAACIVGPAEGSKARDVFFTPDQVQAALDQASGDETDGTD